MTQPTSLTGETDQPHHPPMASTDSGGISQRGSQSVHVAIAPIDRALGVG